MTASISDPAALRPATRPTIYFVGVTTASSSIQRVFPRWAQALGLDDAQLLGIDLPLRAPADDYRRVVDFIAADPLSLGALVTTHKIDLYRAAADRFDEIDQFAQMMGETSCISKRHGRLRCHAKDPISSGLALDAFVPTGHWSTGAGRDVLIMGAGGSAIAISWFLSRAQAGDDVPERVVVTNRTQPRLDHLREIHDSLDTRTSFEYYQVGAEDNDRMLETLSAGALVVNATGLGKDTPGSPLTGGSKFPEQGFAWDLNYRGDLLFLEQARAQSAAGRLHVEDGWTYFLHGWTQVIAEVFGIDIPTSGAEFDRLSDLAIAWT